MSRIRKNHSAEFKSRVALEALKEQVPLSTLSQRFGVHVSQIQKWKTILQKEGQQLFQDKRTEASRSDKKLISQLHEKIGQLTVERDFLGDVLGR